MYPCLPKLMLALGGKVKRPTNAVMVAQIVKCITFIHFAAFSTHITGNGYQMSAWIILSLYRTLLNERRNTWKQLRYCMVYLYIFFFMVTTIMPSCNMQPLYCIQEC